MAGADRVLTFVVRLVRSRGGEIRGTVERVKTGRKERVETVADIAAVIAAMASGEKEIDAAGDAATAKRPSP